MPEGMRQADYSTWNKVKEALLDKAAGKKRKRVEEGEQQAAVYYRKTSDEANKVLNKL